MTLPTISMHSGEAAQHLRWRRPRESTELALARSMAAAWKGPRGRVREKVPVVIVLWWCLSLGTANDLIAEVPVVEAGAGMGRVVVAVDPAESLPPGGRILLTAGVRPVGWFIVSEQQSGRATFVPEGPVATESAGRLRAWRVPPDLIAKSLPDWPTAAPLLAAIDRIGPGARSVWLRTGSHQGVQPGDTWWLRIVGQPVARLETRSVEADASFCAVVALAEELPLRVEQRVELWPTPGERRRGRTHSAVALVQRQGDATIVWVAAPRHVACPPEPHLDFFRRGRYLGHGVVEARDGLFWYARFVPLPDPALSSTRASRPAEPSPATQPDPAASGPIAVADLALVRTQADIAAGRFVARVFEVSSEGALLNAGEAEGLARGQTAPLARAGEVIGQVEVLRVQRGYSVVRPHGERAAFQPIPGDEVRFGPARPRPAAVATVETVAGDCLFTARLTAPAEPPLMMPLGLRSSGRTVGVGILFMAEGATACGFALQPPLEPLRPGDVLVRDLDEPPDAAGR